MQINFEDPIQPNHLKISNNQSSESFEKKMLKDIQKFLKNHPDYNEFKK